MKNYSHLLIGKKYNQFFLEITKNGSSDWERNKLQIRITNYNRNISIKRNQYYLNSSYEYVIMNWVTKQIKSFNKINKNWFIS